MKVFFVIVFLFLLNVVSAQKSIDTISVYNLKNKHLEILVDSTNEGYIIAKYSYFCGSCLAQLGFLSKNSKVWEEKYGLRIIPVTYEYHNQKKRDLKRVSKKFPELNLYIDKSKNLTEKLYYVCEDKNRFKYQRPFFTMKRPYIIMLSPTLFIINKKGEIIFSKVGFDEQSKKEIELFIERNFCEFK